MPGPGSCAICARADAVALNGRMLGGEPVATVARTVGISVSSMHLHWRRCLLKGARVEPKPAPEIKDAPSPESLVMPAPPKRQGEEDPNLPIIESLKELRAIHSAALGAYATAHSTKDTRTMILALPALRKNLELRNKMVAQLVKPAVASERLLSNPDFAEAATAGAAALEAPVEVPAGPLGGDWADGFRAGWLAARDSWIRALEFLDDCEAQ